MSAAAVVLTLWLVPVSAYAAAPEDVIDTSPLVEELPDEAWDYMPEISPLSGDMEKALGKILENVRDKLAEETASVVRTGGILLIISVIVSLADALDTGGKAPGYILLCGVAATASASFSDFDSFLLRGETALFQLSEYSKVVMPMLATVSAAAGAPGSAAARYAAATVFMDFLLSLTRTVIFPGICAYAAASAADAAVGNHVLRTAKKLIFRGITMLLAGISLAFTTWVSLSGVMAESADAVTVRMTRSALTAALPVVGKILSDAAGALASAAGVLRSSIGFFGMTAVLCICAGPFISLGVRYVVYKLAAVVCQCVSDPAISALVEDVGSCFAMMLGVIGTGALMVFVSVFSMIRMVIP